MKERGTFYEVRLPTLPKGMFFVVEIDNISPENKVKPTDMYVIYEGHGSIGEEFVGMGVIRNNLCQGKDTGIVINTEEEVIYPKDFNYGTQGE